MGLNRSAMGIKSVDGGLVIKKKKESDRIIALAGNPNVGKSTVFNRLTGLNQHTGNWPGKTVANAQGYCSHGEQGYVFVDLPGCYSLMAHSAEEEAARDFICFERPDAVVVVCDASCLERNLNLALQVIEASPVTILCVNLMDEAKKRKIQLNLPAISEALGVPVVGTSARSGRGLDELLECIGRSFCGGQSTDLAVTYPAYLEEAAGKLASRLPEREKRERRFLSVRLLDGDESLMRAMERYQVFTPEEKAGLHDALAQIKAEFGRQGITEKQINDDMAASFVRKAEQVCRDTVEFNEKTYGRRDRRLDRIFTSRLTGFPIMFLMLLFIFWLTITGANYPSQLLSKGLFWLEDRLMELFSRLGAPGLVSGLFVQGIYRALAWVVSVMLPPMAIFFPLFTLLEDSGYLPRIAFNLDKCFKRCCACGKQALTICMGFGCNAAGIIGCRIIDSPRERLIAMITNNFVPCNGRFPTLIAIITMFFIGNRAGLLPSLLSSLFLAGVILLGILMTLLVSWLLSKTILKGMPSSFTLELPPYRRPQIGKVIVRSVFDRTLFVLGRAAAVAAPAGLLIWVMANVTVGGNSLLAACAGFLDPAGRLLGMDGVILLAFILGFPANEIVIPVMLMAYLAKGSLFDISDLTLLRQVLVDNGWTWVTAVSVMLFSLMHWPCSTTCLTIRKETGSTRWTLVSFFIPVLAGTAVCLLFNGAVRLFGLIFYV